MKGAGLGKSELLIFDSVLNDPQTSIIDSYFVDIYPTSAIGESKSEIDFLIPGSSSEYLDLNDTLLTISVRILDADGNAFPGKINLYPVNFFMNSLFRDIQLELANVIIEGGNDYYAFKSTIEDILNFDESTKEIQLGPKGYCKDKEERQKWFEGSKPVEFTGALRLNFFSQSKYLIPGVDVRLVLKRSESTFSLMGGETGAERARIVITKAKMRIRKCIVSPSVELAHNEQLKKENAVYAYNVAKMYRHQINVGTLDYSKDNVFTTSILPKFLIVALIPQTAYSGTDTKSDPFNFCNYGLRRMVLNINGNSAPYRDGYNPVFAGDAKSYSDVFMRSIVQGNTHLNRSLNNGVTMKDFVDGPYAFYTFNLTPDYNYYIRQFPKTAAARLEINFTKALDVPINVIIYALYDSRFEITFNREIIKDIHVI